MDELWVSKLDYLEAWYRVRADNATTVEMHDHWNRKLHEVDGGRSIWGTKERLSWLLDRHYLKIAKQFIETM